MQSHPSFVKNRHKNNQLRLLGNCGSFVSSDTKAFLSEGENALTCIQSQITSHSQITNKWQIEQIPNEKKAEIPNGTCQDTRLVFKIQKQTIEEGKDSKQHLEAQRNYTSRGIRDPFKPQRKQKKHHSQLNPERNSQQHQYLHWEFRKSRQQYPKTPTQSQRKICQLQQNYMREHQAFFQERIQFQRQILAKDCRIEILQKLISENAIYGDRERESTTADKGQQPFRNPFLKEVCTDCKKKSVLNGKRHALSTERKPANDYYQLLGQKDKEINFLLQKISELNFTIEQLNKLINTMRYDKMMVDSTAESLKNQLYVIQRKKQIGLKGHHLVASQTEQLHYGSKISNVNFFSQQTGYQEQSVPKVGKVQSFLRLTNFQKQQNQNSKEQIEKIQRRLLLLKLNRIQIQERNKDKKSDSKSKTACFTKTARNLDSYEINLMQIGRKQKGYSNFKKSQDSNDGINDQFWNSKAHAITF